MTGSATSREQGWERLATAVAIVLASVSLGLLAWTIVARSGFPFALEWQESAMLEHARRVFAGGAIYVEPGVDFAPFPYPPLFHWLGAAAIGVLGPTLPSLRVVSIASVAALLVLVFLLCRRRGGKVAGLVGAGVFAGTYTWTGQWLDVARVDTLALALMAASIACASSEPPTGGSTGRARRVAQLLLAGLLGALAVLAKQTSLGVVVAVAAGLAFQRGRRRDAVPYAAAAGSVLVLACVWLQARSDGWFWFTVVDLLAGSPWYRPAILGYWGECAMVFAPIAMLWWLGRRAEVERKVDPVLVLSLIALVLIAWVGRAHEGGFRNTLLPAALAGAIIAGPAIARACTARPLASIPLVAVTFAVSIAAFPRSPFPSERQVEHAAHVAERIAAIDGEVWQPHGAVDPTVAGGVHAMAINDLLKSGERGVAQAFIDALTRALDERRFAAIVLGVQPEEWADFEALGRNYVVTEVLERPDAGTAGGAAQLTGADRRPRVLLVPR